MMNQSGDVQRVLLLSDYFSRPDILQNSFSQMVFGLTRSFPQKADPNFVDSIRGSLFQGSYFQKYAFRACTIVRQIYERPYRS